MGGPSSAHFLLFSCAHWPLRLSVYSFLVPTGLVPLSYCFLVPSDLYCFLLSFPVPTGLYCLLFTIS